MARETRLDVPMFFQPEHSKVCGAACARMVAAYHGHRHTLKRLVRDLRIRNGTFSSTVGRWFLECGYGVSIIGHGCSWPNRFIDLAPREAQREVRRWADRQRRSRTMGQPSFGRSYLRYIDAGGTVVPRPVRPSDILTALRRGLPPIISLDESILTRGRELFDPHFIVITGHVRGRFLCNDPYPGIGGRVAYDAEELLYAHARRDGDLIIAKPGP